MERDRDPIMSSNPELSPAEIKRRIESLGPWFHNMCLGGHETAPSHPLGNYPSIKWKRFASAISSEVYGKTVLDIGCNAGFYAIEMKRLGAAHVLAIDEREDYLAQARFAAEMQGVEIELRQMSVYDVAKLRQQFDLVLFLGVLYHLRHPLLALDLIYDNVVKDRLVVQSMLRGTPDVEPVELDYDFWQTDHFDRPGYPKLHFVEARYAADDTNWWVPNRACLEAMLRSAGFEIIEHPEAEVYVCRRLGDRGQG